MEVNQKVFFRIIRLYGIVQGVGFRPFVSRAAAAFGIRGSVANKGSYVEVYAQGTSRDLELFTGELKNNPPPRSMVLKVEIIDR